MVAEVFGSGGAVNVVDRVNQFAENSAVLAGNATRNGASHDTGDASDAGGLGGWSRFRVFVSADQAGTVAVEQSRDGATWYRTLSQPYAAATPTIIESLVTLRYVRGVVVNGATLQTAFEFDTCLVAI